MATLADLVVKVSADVRNAAGQMQALSTQIQSTMGSAAAAIDNAGKRIQGVGTSLSRTGTSLSRNVTVPLALAGGAAFKMASDFESSMAKIVGLAGVPREQVQAWEGDVRRLAVTYGSSASAAADALFFITSSGIPAAEAMDVLEASLKASAAGMGDVSIVADLTTSAVNAYKDSGLTAAEATDILVAAVREGKLEAEDLTTSMGRVFPVASAMGVQMHEVAAAMSAMSLTGTNADEAATQLRAILSELLKPSVEAEKTLSELGLSAEGLRKQIKEEGLLATLETLTTTFDGNTAATASVFGNIRALSGVMDMMGGNVDATRSMFENLAGATGDTNEAFAVMSDTTQFKLQVAIAQVKDLLLEVGQAVIPVVVDVLNQLVPIVESLAARWRELSPETQRFIVQAALIAAAVGPMLLILGKLVTLFGGLVRGIGLVIQIVGLLIPVFKAVGLAFAVLSKLLLAHPFILLAAAIVALVVVVVKNWDTIKNAISKAWEFIKNVTITVWNAVVDFLKKNWQIILAVIAGPIGIIVALIIKNWDTIKKVTTAVWNAIKNVVSIVINVIKSVVSSGWNAIKSAVQTALNAVRSAVSTAWNAVSSVVSSVVGRIKSFVVNGFNALRSAATTAVRRLKDGVVNVFQSLVSFVSGIPNRIIGFFRSLPGRLWQVGKNIIQSLINGISSMIGAVGNAIGNVVSKVTNLWPFSPAKEGPLRRHPPELAGRNIGRLFADGLSASGRDVVAAAEAITRAAALDPLAAASRLRLGDLGEHFDAATAGIATPSPGPQRIVWDITGADEDLKRMIRRMARTSGLQIEETV